MRRPFILAILAILPILWEERHPLLTILQVTLNLSGPGKEVTYLLSLMYGEVMCNWSEVTYSCALQVVLSRLN